MLRIAVLSDIHGNTRALDAVIADLAWRDVDAIVNLGDCLYGPFDPRPTADRLLETSWPTVAGNEDRCLLMPDDPEFGSTARFTRDRLTDRHCDWLAQLPAIREIENRILAFHGSLSDDRAYLLSRPDGSGGMRPADGKEIMERLGNFDARLILCGHDHLPRVVHLDGGRTIVNPGSVGCPAYSDDHPIPHAVENGTPHARYAIVTIDGDEISVDSIGVEYDWDAAAKEAEANGFPDWARWIATGCV